MANEGPAVANEGNVERRLRSTGLWLIGDDGARWAFRIALAISMVVFAIVGRHQWFIRDDWAFLISRNALRDRDGLGAWLFTAQDGHWMTPPILVYRTLENVFGIGSYWPYLIVLLATHVGIVLLVRAVCRRVGASMWTTTLLCSVLLVFGSGWENIVFAIQITYNLSLLCFLAQVLLVDHDGRLNRRDVLGAVVGLVGIMSSGFGPFFAGGIAILMILRRRWLVLAITAVPQLLAYGWWWLAWGSDLAAEREQGPTSQVPAFAVRGVTATFEGLLALPSLAGLGILATLAITIWRVPGWRTQSVFITMWVTVGAMFLGVGLQRIGFGVDSAAASRYQYMAAMLLVPALAVAIDQLGRWSETVRWSVRALLAASVVLNAGWLQTSGAEWAARAQEQKNIYELLAGTNFADPQFASVDLGIRPYPFSPDVSVAYIGYLASEGAIVGRTPTTPEELALVRRVLGLDPAPTPAVTP